MEVDKLAMLVIVEELDASRIETRNENLLHHKYNFKHFERHC
jgi:hypothetical protein